MSGKNSKLIDAAQRGREDIVKKLIDAGADVNTKEHGRTALSWAAFSGFAGIVKMLSPRIRMVRPPFQLLS
jgi:ankyrin repeat protein